MAAALEQRHDDRGAIWPKSIAPFDVALVQVQMKDDDQGRVAAQVYEDLTAQGWDVLWDDRDERAGVKFADAELVGCPVRVTAVSYTHLRAHETDSYLVCRLLLEK